MEEIQSIAALYRRQHHHSKRKQLLINKKQTRSMNLLKYERPRAIGYERADHTIRFYHKMRDSSGSGYMKGSSPDIPGFCKTADTMSHEKIIRGLNNILPPLEWIADGLYWKQYVSKKLANRRAAIKLDKEFLRRLETKHAKALFLCPIRSHIYKQCFDEIIRQVLLENQLRGILLVKCRDELYHTIKYTDRLWQSHMAFSARKGLKLVHTKKELIKAKIKKHHLMKSLENEKKMMIKKIQDYKDNLWKSHDFEFKKYVATVKKLKEENGFLKKQLTSMTDKTSVALKNKSLAESAAASSVKLPSTTSTITSIKAEEKGVNSVTSIKAKEKGVNSVTSIKSEEKGLNSVTSIKAEEKGVNSVTSIKAEEKGVNSVTSIKAEEKGVNSVTSIKAEEKGVNSVTSIKVEEKGVNSSSNTPKESWFKIQDNDEE